MNRQQDWICKCVRQTLVKPLPPLSIISSNDLANKGRRGKIDVFLKKNIIFYNLIFIYFLLIEGEWDATNDWENHVQPMSSFILVLRLLELMCGGSTPAKEGAVPIVRTPRATSSWWWWCSPRWHLWFHQTHESQPNYVGHSNQYSFTSDNDKDDVLSRVL